MSDQGNTAARPAAMGVFERYLTIWLALCIVAGVTLGHFLPYMTMAALFSNMPRDEERRGQACIFAFSFSVSCQPLELDGENAKMQV